MTAKLDAGGLGKVYRATDSKLGREVAVKMLPEAFAPDAQRRARFQREAQVLASLNHPTQRVHRADVDVAATFRSAHCVRFRAAAGLRAAAIG